MPESKNKPKLAMDPCYKIEADPLKNSIKQQFGASSVELRNEFKGVAVSKWEFFSPGSFLCRAEEYVGADAS